MASTTLQAVKSGGAVASAERSPAIAALTNAIGKMKSVLPEHITGEKMARLALNEMRTNPLLAKIAQKNPESLVASVMLASQLGLEIGGAKGHGYLVPYGDKITFMPGYRGLIALARNSGQVTSISVHIVFEKDEFDMTLGVEEKIVHKPYLEGPRGERRLVYGVAHFTDGAHHFDWMSMADVDHVKKSSQSKGNSGPWKDHTDEMIRKTMVRRLAKYLPLSADRYNAAVAVNDAVDNGRNVTIDGDFNVVEEDAVEAEGTTRQIEAGGTTDGATGEISFTFAEVDEKLQKATSLDQLDEAATLIASVGNRQQQKELNDTYAERRAKVGGEA